MIAIIRIVGQAKNQDKHEETFTRLKLGRKFTCRLVEEDDRIRVGMIESLKDVSAYGKISDELAKEIVEKRGKEGKDVCFLHPPRGGFKKSSKVAYPKGILGHNKEISKLIERML
ncbi:MAG: ribosomal protein L30/L7E [Patescibacteria group bacterium]|jgi:ribosomal protein L30/L7E